MNLSTAGVSKFMLRAFVFADLRGIGACGANTLSKSGGGCLLSPSLVGELLVNAAPLPL